MNTFLISQLFFVMGLCVGIGGTAAVCFGVAYYVGLKIQLDRADEAERTDPIDDLVGLAVEVLRLLERPYWDMPTVMYMAKWLHLHEYTPLSDPAEVAAVVRKEE